MPVLMLHCVVPLCHGNATLDVCSTVGCHCVCVGEIDVDEEEEVSRDVVGSDIEVAMNMYSVHTK